MGVPYRNEEDKKIIRFILAKPDRPHRTKSNSLWIQMAKVDIFKNRSWGSLRDHYRRSIMTKIKCYDLNTEEISRLQTGFNKKSHRKQTTTFSNTSMLGYVMREDQDSVNGGFSDGCLSPAQTRLRSSVTGEGGEERPGLSITEILDDQIVRSPVTLDLAPFQENNFQDAQNGEQSVLKSGNNVTPNAKDCASDNSGMDGESGENSNSVVNGEFYSRGADEICSFDSNLSIDDDIFYPNFLIMDNNNQSTIYDSDSCGIEIIDNETFGGHDSDIQMSLVTNDSLSNDERLKAKPFTAQDDMDIIHYLWCTKRYDKASGKKVWLSMVEDRMPDRDWDTLRGRFRRSIYPYLLEFEVLGVPRKILQKMKHSLDHKWSNKSYILNSNVMKARTRIRSAVGTVKWQSTPTVGSSANKQRAAPSFPLVVRHSASQLSDNSLRVDSVPRSAKRPRTRVDNDKENDQVELIVCIETESESSGSEDNHSETIKQSSFSSSKSNGGACSEKKKKPLSPTDKTRALDMSALKPMTEVPAGGAYPIYDLDDSMSD